LEVETQAPTMSGGGPGLGTKAAIRAPQGPPNGTVDLPQVVLGKATCSADWETSTIAVTAAAEAESTVAPSSRPMMQNPENPRVGTDWTLECRVQRIRLLEILEPPLRFQILLVSCHLHLHLRRRLRFLPMLPIQLQPWNTELSQRSCRNINNPINNSTSSIDSTSSSTHSSTHSSTRSSISSISSSSSSSSSSSRPGDRCRSSSLKVRSIDRNKKRQPFSIPT